MTNSTSDEDALGVPSATHSDRGFTLVEILIAIVLVGILSVVVIVGISNLTESGSSAACKASQDAATTGSRAYLASAGSYPTTLTQMTSPPKPSLELPSGVTVDPTGMSATGSGWTLTMTPGAAGASPTFACTTAGSAAAPNGTTACPGTYVNWVGEYYANRTLTGAAALCRDDAAISFNWGSGAPGGTLPADQFSVRWTRTVAFTAGSHVFTIGRDDGARLYIDGALVFNNWSDTAIKNPLETVTQSLTAGNHTIVMEYYENGGQAQASLAWT
jgi:prepilin-type N-terminal cleavage/methylation domain-containing protein